jgi:hypothetical protein
LTTVEVPPDVLQEQARDAYRASVAAELPLTGDALGRMYNRSGRWGRDRIAEARAEEPVAMHRQPIESGGSGPVATMITPPIADGPEDTVRLPPAVNGNAVAAASLPSQLDGSEVAATLPGVAVTRLPPGSGGSEAAAVALPPVRPAPAQTPSEQQVATRLPRSWPVLLLALPAFVAIWGGWVGLGELAGFGPVNLLPGIGQGWTINTAITLPIGVEAYAAFALRVWLSSGSRPAAARRFAMWSAIGSLVLGMAGQVAYHLMAAAGMTKAPWQITTFVSCLPVVVLGCGAALAHLLHNTSQESETP